MMEFALGIALTAVALMADCIAINKSAQSFLPHTQGLPLTDYIAINTSAQSFHPHTQGRHQMKRFRKAL